MQTDLATKVHAVIQELLPRAPTRRQPQISKDLYTTMRGLSVDSQV